LDDLGLYEGLEKQDGINTAFLYRLLEFVEMSKKAKEDPMQTMWKSKLNYLVSRNLPHIDKELLSTIDRMIEVYPREAKMVLSEFIYKRREV